MVKELALGVHFAQDYALEQIQTSQGSVSAQKGFVVAYFYPSICCVRMTAR